MRPMSKQRGATLLVSLVMLVVLTLFVLSAINLTNVNLRIVGNMQIHKEIQAAAQMGIEKTIAVPLTTATTEPDVTVDINHDGVTDYTAKVTKKCLGMKRTPGTDPTVFIYDSTWDVRSEVNDPRTGAKTVIHQGVSVLAGGACP